MKTLVVKGAFQKISSGQSGGQWNAVEFFEIDGKRILRVAWTQYMDCFVREAKGKVVEMAFVIVGGVHRLVCLKYDGKTEKDPNKYVVDNASKKALIAIAAFIGFLVVGITVGVISDAGMNTIMTIWLGGFAVFGLVLPLKQVNTMHASALKLID